MKNDNVWYVAVGVIITVLFSLAFSLGSVIQANTISFECEKVGAFYVGSKVYTCERKK